MTGHREKKTHLVSEKLSTQVLIQDPVSTMQKTGFTNYSPFRVSAGLEKGITYGCEHYGAVDNHLPVY